MTTSTRPISRALVGAAFTSCVMMSVPGFTLLLANSDLSAPDLRALSAEIILGAIAAVFGALQIQALTRSSGRWIGLLPLAAFAGTALVIGVAFVLAVGSGSVDSGPAILLGFFGVLVVVAFQMGLGALTWFLLSSFAKALDRDAASGIDPDVTVSRWLGVAAIIHVVLKCASGGPALFGFFAAALAVSHALRAKQNLGLVLGALSIAASVSTGIGTRVYFAHKNALERLPQCEGEGVVASDVRAMPGVADVLVYAPSPYGGPDLTVVVLPIGGGSVPAAMKETITRDAMSSGCVVDTVGTRPRVTVVDPKYVEIPVLARVHLAPGANADEARKALTAAARDHYDPHAGANLIRDPASAGNETPSTPQDAGVQLVDWMTGSEYLGTKIDELEIGSVPTLGKLEFELVTDQ
jgi:hypothetical protein